MKWLYSLIFLTFFFIVSSFFIPTKLVIAYRWMTLGMALVSFIFYIITKKNDKNKSANITAIGVKFITSSLVFILYIIVFKSKNTIDYYIFILAYILFSVVSYAGAYIESPKNK